MKNKFLLLGATALLSMGAVVANAAFDSEATQVDVKAEIIHARILDATPLDFGRIVIEESATSINVAMDSSGNTKKGGKNGDALYILTQGAKGVVTGANCNQLDWSEDLNTINRLDLNPPTGTTVNEAYLYTPQCIDDDSGNATFYATMAINNASGIPAGNYTGSFTVTAIYPVEEPEPEEP